MNLGERARFVFALSTLLGCASSVGAGDAGPRSDARLPPDVRPHCISLTYDWVVTRVVIGGPQAPPPGDRGNYGFNLDGRFTQGPQSEQSPEECNHLDHFSTLDPDQNEGACADGAPRGGPTCAGGVDNQLPALASTLAMFPSPVDLQRRVDQDLRAARVTLLVRTSGFCDPLSPENDAPNVRVLVYPHAWPLFDDCAQTATPGMPWQVDDASLDRPNDLSSALFQFEARMVRGRLRTSPGSEGDRFVLPRGGASTPLTLRAMRLRVDLLDEERATSGNVGGWLVPSELTDALAARPGALPREALEVFVNAFVDLGRGTAGPRPVCMRDEDRIGVGMGFEMVRAVIAPTTTAGRPAGTCAP